MPETKNRPLIGFLIPSTDKNILKSGADSIAYSPFTMVFEKCGLAFACSVMNAVILTSVLYVASRMLYSLSKKGKATKFLSKVNKRGIPANAI